MKIKLIQDIRLRQYENRYFYCELQPEDELAEATCLTCAHKSLATLQKYMMKEYGISSQDFLNLLNEYNQSEAAA